MRILLILILLISNVYAYEINNPRYIFKLNNSKNYMYEKKEIDHLEIVRIYPKDSEWGILVIPKVDYFLPHIINYGKNSKDLIRDYKLNARLIYEDKNFIQKIKYNLNKKKWDDAINSLNIALF